MRIGMGLELLTIVYFNGRTTEEIQQAEKYGVRRNGQGNDASAVREENPERRSDAMSAKIGYYQAGNRDEEAAASGDRARAGAGD